jgi:hypothetical protein
MMLRKLLEYFGFWSFKKIPTLYVGPSTCETIDSAMMVRIMAPKQTARNRWF